MFPFALIGPRGPGKDATPGEHLAAGIMQLLVPTVLFFLVLFTGLGNYELLLLVAPVLLALGGYVLSRYLSDSLGFALVNSFLGAVWSFVALAVGLLLAGLADFYSNF